MDPSLRGQFTLRPGFVLLFFGISGSLLTALFLLSWFFLPHWQPKLVINYSPWFSPAFEAAVLSNSSQELAIRANDFGESCLPELSKELMSGDSKRIKMAISILNGLPSGLCAEPLLNALSISDDQNSFEIIRILSEKKASLCFKQVKNRILTLHSSIRFWAASYAMYLPAQNRYDVLNDLRKDPKIEYQALACVLLTKDDDSRSIAYLKSKIGTLIGNYGYFREEVDPAIAALSRNPSPEALSLLITELESGDPQRRLNVLHFASNLHSNKEFYAAVCNCLDDKSLKVQQRIYEILATYRDPASLALLSKGLKKDDDSSEYIVSLIHNAGRDDQTALLYSVIDSPRIGFKVVESLAIAAYDSNDIDRALDAIERRPQNEQAKLLSKIESKKLSPEQVARYKTMKAAAP